MILQSNLADARTDVNVNFRCVGRYLSRSTMPNSNIYRESTAMSEWTKDSAFVPEIGRCYEIAFGEVITANGRGHASARIRADGLQWHDWIDLDYGEPLSGELGKYVVRAYRPIECPTE